MKKRGVFFSIDAIIAFSIILLTIIAVSVSVSHSKKETQIPGDLIKSLSVLKAGEIDNLYFKQLLADGIITDSNKSVLEQIGEFYVTNISRAREAAESIFEDLNISDNIGIWYGDELIASKNKTSFENAKNIKVERQVISGLQEGGSVTGFSSRAYLESELKSKYFYFGGYVGDGNLSMIINYTGDIEKVILEITSNKNFTLYINDNHCGAFEASSSYFLPVVYPLSAYKDYFTSGENKITLQGNTSSLFVAGGYLKIEYKNSTDFYNQLNHYYFPGIEGLINLYDGFYIPGELNEMEIFLHYHSNYSIFLNIGNTTVYNGSDENEMSVTITNSELSGLLDYSEIVNKTIPLRLGMDNVSYISTIRKYVDVYSVTDLSGSMDYCSELYQCNYTCTIGGFRSCLTLRPCSDRPCVGWGCGGYSGSCPAGLTLLELAKDANKEFIDVILENEGNKVGLVGYSTSVIAGAFHNLSDNQTSLNNKIDEWTTGVWTNICAGIHDAMVRLNQTNYENRLKVMVVMSDGEANYNCNGNYGIADAKQAAIDKACEAYEDYNITVHAVGFGSDADEVTLQEIAACGNGSYYSGEVSELAELYTQIAQDIIEASYVEQTIEITSGEVNVTLFPDSYIWFDYSKKNIPYGLLMTIEENFYNETHGNFTIPENSTLVEANVISYSGPRWTSLVKINNEVIYNINDYSGPFISLGDPYRVNIPVEKVDGENPNQIELYTAINAFENTNGSINNKIIYTIIKNFVSYSPISPYASGCRWEIQFEDDTTIEINVPQTYSGTETCYYNNSGQSYNVNDAIQISTYELLKKLDFNDNRKIDFKFSEGDLVISSFELVGIPYSWSTEVQIRRWD